MDAWCEDCEDIYPNAHFRHGHVRGFDVSCLDCECCHCPGKCEGEHNCFAAGCECATREEDECPTKTP